ncbi:MAG: hypothetical protein LBG96_16190 [Tannerella sp.]|jgi:hypothetical protein|nr:hypothetical protein [Tannerella sp.]
MKNNFVALYSKSYSLMKKLFTSFVFVISVSALLAQSSSLCARYLQRVIAGDQTTGYLIKDSNRELIDESDVKLQIIPEFYKNFSFTIEYITTNCRSPRRGEFICNEADLVVWDEKGKVSVRFQDGYYVDTRRRSAEESEGEEPKVFFNQTLTTTNRTTSPGTPYPYAVKYSEVKVTITEDVLRSIANADRPSLAVISPEETSRDRVIGSVELVKTKPLVIFTFCEYEDNTKIDGSDKPVFVLSESTVIPTFTLKCKTNKLKLTFDYPLTDVWASTKLITSSQEEFSVLTEKEGRELMLTLPDVLITGNEIINITLSNGSVFRFKVKYDMPFHAPDVSLSENTYCASTDGIQVILNNNYDNSVSVFAEYNNTSSLIYNDVYIKPGSGSIKFFAQAYNQTGCKLYNPKEFQITEYPAPINPQLDGLMADCGNGTTLAHSNPEYGVQYWLYTGNDQLIKHKGANFWLFRKDQYDESAPGSGEVNAEAHREMFLKKGDYKIVATHDANNCTGTLPFTIVDAQAEIDLKAKTEDMIICQADELFNLFDLFEDGDIKDLIENEIGGVSFNFVVTTSQYSSTVTVATILRKHISTADLSANQNYLATLTINTAAGCVRVVEKQFAIKARPATAVTITTDATETVCGAQWELTVNYPDNDLTYTWFLDDEQQTDGISYVADGLPDGNHSAYAVATNAAGCVRKSNVVSAVARSFSNQAQLNTAAVEFCQENRNIDLFDFIMSSDADLADLKAQNNITYVFSFGYSGPAVIGVGAHTIDLSTAQPNVNPYTLTLTLQQNGCTRIFTKPVLIKARPAPFTISTSETTLCNEATVTLTATTPVQTTSWYADNTLLPASGTTTQHAVSTAGITNYYAVADLDGCTQQSNTVAVERKFVDFSNISFDGTPVSFCQADTRIELFDYVAGTEKDNVQNMYDGWGRDFSATPNGLVLDGTKLVLSSSVAAGTPYTLTFTINKNGCFTSFTKPVSIRARPDAPVLTKSADNLCNDQTATITATTNTNHIEWYVNSVKATTGGINYLHTEAGTSPATTYSAVALTSLAADACRSQESEPVLITSSAPIGTFSMSKSCYTRNEYPKINTSGLQNTQSVSAVAIRSGAQMSISLDNNYQFTSKLVNGTWEIQITVTSVAGCSKTISLGTITVSDACPVPGSVPGSVGAISASACPECEDCETVRQINNELESIYNDYLYKWRLHGSYKALISPTSSANGAAVKVYITSAGQSGLATLQIFDVVGGLLGTKSAYITPGENIIDITTIRRTTGIYLIQITYPDLTSEIIKGLTE